MGRLLVRTGRATPRNRVPDTATATACGRGTNGLGDRRIHRRQLASVARARSPQLRPCHRTAPTNPPCQCPTRACCCATFRCSDERDLTYFGEAFYRDALPRSATLQEAFSRASTDIASREQREGVRASKPQAYFGAAMEKKLAEIDSTAHCNTGCRQSVPESQPIGSTQRRDHPPP